MTRAAEGPAPDPRALSLNTATVRIRRSLAQMIDDWARHGIRGLAPRRDQLAGLDVAEAARRIRDAGLVVTGLCRGGLFPAADAAARRAAIDDNRRAIDDAAMPLAIEPLHPMYAADRACVNAQAQALDLCDALGPGGCGAAVRASCLRLARAHPRPARGPRHHGRRRDRPRAHPRLGRGGRLPRPARAGDFLVAQLVAARSGRGARADEGPPPGALPSPCGADRSVGVRGQRPVPRATRAGTGAASPPLRNSTRPRTIAR